MQQKVVLCLFLLSLQVSAKRTAQSESGELDVSKTEVLAVDITNTMAAEDQKGGEEAQELQSEKDHLVQGASSDVIQERRHLLQSANSEMHVDDSSFQGNNSEMHAEASSGEENQRVQGSDSEMEKEASLEQEDESSHEDEWILPSIRDMEDEEADEEEHDKDEEDYVSARNVSASKHPAQLDGDAEEFAPVNHTQSFIDTANATVGKTCCQVAIEVYFDDLGPEKFDKYGYFLCGMSSSWIPFSSFKCGQSKNRFKMKYYTPNEYKKIHYEKSNGKKVTMQITQSQQVHATDCALCQDIDEWMKVTVEGRINRTYMDSDGNMHKAIMTVGDRKNEEAACNLLKYSIDEEAIKRSLSDPDQVCQLGN